ncbi:MAG: hypothetical protein QM729_21200 [Solirubrobacterales bacterium]
MNNEPKELFLRSTDTVFTPGVITFLRAQAEFQPELVRKLLIETYSGLMDADVNKVLAGEFRVDGDTVVIAR